MILCRTYQFTLIELIISQVGSSETIRVTIVSICFEK